MAPYPTREEIRKIFTSLADGDTETFLSHVSPTVKWDVLGNHPCAGRFNSLEEWKKGALAPISKVLREPLKLKVHNIVGGGEQEWAVIELKADATCLNGMPYNQEYAWIMRFDEKGTVVEARAYLDSALVQKAVEENT